MGNILEPMRLSFHGCWMEDQSQLLINMLEMMAIRLPLKKAIKFIHHSCVMISTDNTTLLLYQQTKWITFLQPIHRGMGDTPLVPGTRCSDQSLSYSRQIQHFGRPTLVVGQTYRNGMGFGSIDCEFHIPNAQLSQCGPVCDMIQSQTPIVCISSSRQLCPCNRYLLNELGSFSCICISSFYSDTCCSSQDSSVSVQNSSGCSSVTSTAVVLRGSTVISVRANTSSAFSKTFDTSKRKKSPTSRPSCLGVIKQSIRDKNFSQNIADFVSKSRRISTQKVSDAKWIVYSNWCRRKKVNPVSTPLTVIADFLIYPFSEKKYKKGTIKGYRAMISNTLKFKTGNRVGYNAVLSKLISSFELQRSLTPK